MIAVASFLKEQILRYFESKKYFLDYSLKKRFEKYFDLIIV